MSAENKSVRELFLAALELPAGLQREAYLQDTCEQDPCLRQRIEELLQMHAGAGQFLEGSAPEDLGLTLSSPEFSAEKSGDRIGHYKLLQELGEGGCGVVYMAEQEEPIRRRVALKVIKLGMDTRHVIARFEAERQALALMDHPNIARVLDAGATVAGRPYFVMELVRGTKITDYCDEHCLSTEARLKLFIQVCQAIQHAHQKGIIHRDIKPSNILVTQSEGEPLPKVIDFGIAKATGGAVLTDKTLFTAFEQFIGTPAYMSPEQAELTLHDIDTRTDIYALGVLLYELLTARTPFEQKELVAAGLEKMRRMIKEQEPVRPSTRLSTLGKAEQTTVAKRRNLEPPQLIHQVRGDLDWIVMKCLEKSPDRRYETANGLAMDVKSYLDSEPVSATPPSSLYRFRKTVRRHKMVFGSGLAVMSTLLAGALLSTWQAGRAMRAEQKANDLLALEQEARSRADTNERIARQRAYASDMLLAQQAIAANNFELAKELLEQGRPIAGDGNLSDWEWRFLWQYCQSDALFELCRQSSSIMSLSASSDGRWLAIGELEQGGCSVWDLKTLHELSRLRGGSREVITAFSPKQPLLAFTANWSLIPVDKQAHLRFWDAKAQRVSDRELPLDAYCRGVFFSDDGRTLATFTMDNHLTLWRFPEGTKLASFPTPLQQGMIPPLATAVSRDARLAAYAAPDGWICLLDLVTGQARWSAKAADEYVWALSISADGKRIASLGSSAKASLRVWDAVSGKEIARAEDGMEGGLGGVVLWPDGKRLASIHANQTIQIWEFSGSGNLQASGRPLRGHRGGISCLALLPDQSTLVTGGHDGSVCLWDVSSNRSDETQVTLPVPIEAWRFAQDSQSILAIDRQGEVARWQGGRFQDRGRLFTVGTNVLQANFSEDGSFLAVAPTNGLIQVWDVSRGARLGEFASLTMRAIFDSPGLIFFARGTKLLVLDPDRVIHEWDLTTWREIHSWKGPPRTDTLAVSPDETKCLALGRSGHHGPCVLHDLITGLEWCGDLKLDTVEDVAFSPNGRQLAAASSFGGAKLWNTGTLHETAPLPAFLDPTTSVAFSPNSRRLAVGGGGERAITVWDVQSRRHVLTLSGQGGMFSSTAFSPDGNTLGSVNSKGILHFWHAPSWEEIAAAEAKKPTKVP